MLCKSCLTLRQFIPTIRLVKRVYTTGWKWKLPLKTQMYRLFADDAAGDVQRYYQGKKLTEEAENPLLYKHMLLMVSGYDEAVLDNYLQFIHKAAKMIEVDLTKSFNMPAIKEKIKTNDQTSGEIREYKLKKYQRVAEVSNITSDKSDIFLEYMQEQMPEGIQVKIELKRWEELVAPDHPALQKEELVGHTGK